MTERAAAISWITFTSVLCVAGQTLAKVGLSRLELSASPRVADFARMLGSPLVWTGGVVLVAGTLLWFHVLSRYELSMALPLACLLSLVISVAAGRLCFGEALPAVRIAGLLLALVAVWLIAGGKGGG
jgi:hypothetical protein